MLSNERELCLFDTASNAPARQLHSSASNIVVLGVRTNPSLRRTLIGIRSDDLDRALNSDCTHETVPKARQYDFVSTLGTALSDKRAMAFAAAALKLTSSTTRIQQRQPTRQRKSSTRCSVECGHCCATATTGDAATATTAPQAACRAPAGTRA